jgi:hypothetical protein
MLLGILFSATLLLSPVSGGDDNVLNSVRNALVCAQNTRTLNGVELVCDNVIEGGIYFICAKTNEPRVLGLTMFDETNDLVAQTRLNLLVGSNYKFLNLEDLPNGIYRLRLTCAETNETKEIAIKKDGL